MIFRRPTPLRDTRDQSKSRFLAPNLQAPFGTTPGPNYQAEIGQSKPIEQKASKQNYQVITITNNSAFGVFFYSFVASGDFIQFNKLPTSSGGSVEIAFNFDTLTIVNGVVSVNLFNEWINRKFYVKEGEWYSGLNFVNGLVRMTSDVNESLVLLIAKSDAQQL